MKRRSLFALGLGSLIWNGIVLGEEPVVLPVEVVPAEVVPAEVTPIEALPVETSKDEAAKLEFFEKKIRPLLVDHCYTCHSASTNARSGLRVDERRGILAGGNRGASIVSGKPEESLLLKSVKHEPGVPSMPPGEKLEQSQIDALSTWIADGAVWPVSEVHITNFEEHPEDYADLLADHWSWQPLTNPAAPQKSNTTWGANEIDQFVLDRLQRKELTPSPRAAKTDLVRRATYDLTGLPPTVEEVDRFVTDNSPDAFAKLVDRLLESPGYGEHWGRHWLDVARYAESTGSVRNIPYPHAWRYRDYVIDSVQNDKPYNQFITEQIAGDLLPFDNQEQHDSQVVATGFLALGVKDVNQRFKNRYILDNIDEQIDTLSQAVLGLTVSCARCHDHKFDPIPTKDYYALVGILQSSDLCAGLRNRMGGSGLDYYDTSMLLPLGGETRPPQTPEQVEARAKAQEDFQEARKEFQRLQRNEEGAELAKNGRPKRQNARQKMQRLQAVVAALDDPALLGPVAIGVRDSKEIIDAEIRVRGEAENYGPVVPRGNLSLFKFDEIPEIQAGSSGRLELAQWLVHPENPLTQRVIVNRIWSHLLGQGIVTTVDNFGVNGDHPSHPELLDYLAQRFTTNNWSTKALIKEIMLSETYQQSSAVNEIASSVDPANRWLWRHTPRRLSAEQIRDTILATAHVLDYERPEVGVTSDLKVIEMNDVGEEARRFAKIARESQKRSLYLPLLRAQVPTALQVFDFADQGMVTGSRSETTVAPQALFMLNDPFVISNSQKVAQLIVQNSSNDQDRIFQSYRLILGRLPETNEEEQIVQYVNELKLALAEIDEANRQFAEQDALDAANLALAVEATSAPEATVTDAATSEAAPVQLEVIDPDSVIPVAVVEPEAEKVHLEPEVAAWASVIQALYASAEFRHLK